MGENRAFQFSTADTSNCNFCISGRVKLTMLYLVGNNFSSAFCMASITISNHCDYEGYTVLLKSSTLDVDEKMSRSSIDVQDKRWQELWRSRPVCTYLLSMNNWIYLEKKGHHSPWRLALSTLCTNPQEWKYRQTISRKNDPLLHWNLGTSGSQISM